MLPEGKVAPITPSPNDTRRYTDVRLLPPCVRRKQRNLSNKRTPPPSFFFRATSSRDNLVVETRLLKTLTDTVRFQL